MVNGLRLSPSKPKELHSGFRVILGDWHTFRFKCDAAPTSSRSPPRY